MLDALSKLRSHVRIPLYGNAYALILSSATTSILGFVYWIIAARISSAETVGVNSALISVMLILSNISQFSLAHALNRFLPRAGAAAGRIIWSAYLASMAAALLTSVAFLLFVELWTPALSDLLSNAAYAVGFVVATIACCVFALQDGAFIGLRKAAWVPVENLMFSLIKIALLILFVSMLPGIGIFASWTVAMVAMVIPVNVLIFAYLVPRHAEPADPSGESHDARTIMRFVVGDYSASLIGNLPYFLLPLIVLEKFGASANAYYYMAWTITYSLYLVGQNIAMSLIAEAARHPARLGRYSYRSLLQGARLIVPAVVILMLAAPFVLGLFGPEYAAEGVSLFRLLCLSAIPNLVVAIYIGVVRVQRRMIALSCANGARTGLIFGLTFFFIEVHGIEGIGIAILLSNLIVAAVLIVNRLGLMWLPFLNLRPLVSSLARLRGSGRHRLQELRAERAAKVLSELLERVPASTHHTDVRSWSVRERLASLNDVSVFTLKGVTGEPIALLKIACSSRASDSLEKHASAVERLGTDPRLKELSVRLPVILARNHASGRQCLIESRLSGVTASRFVSSPRSRIAMQQAAVESIGMLHSNTAHEVRLDDAWCEQWVREPIKHIAQAMANSVDGELYTDALEQLGEDVESRLMDKRAIVSWIHGDFSLENILLDDSGSRVIGILDWDRAAADGLPCLDTVLLILATLARVKNRELGDIVGDLLEKNAWDSDEKTLLEEARRFSGAVDLGLKDLVLLCWLNHVDANLSKADRYTRSRIWKSKNIAAVLHRFLELGDERPCGAPQAGDLRAV